MSQIVTGSLAAAFVVGAWVSLQGATADRDAGHRWSALLGLLAAWSFLALAFVLLLGVRR